MKFGTIKLAGQPCLVMQHNNGGMCRVDQLLATADAENVATMLDLVRSIGEEQVDAAAVRRLPDLGDRATRRAARRRSLHHHTPRAHRYQGRPVH